MTQNKKETAQRVRMHLRYLLLHSAFYSVIMLSVQILCNAVHLSPSRSYSSDVNKRSFLQAKCSSIVVELSVGILVA